MSRFDNELMFADGLAMDGTAEIKTSDGVQAVDLYPLTAMLGRNIGVGTSVYIEVYGAVVTGTLTGTLTITLYTDADLQMGSPTTLWSKASLAIPTATGAKALIHKMPFPIYPNLERYVALSFTPSADWNNNLLIYAGVTIAAPNLRAVGSGMNFI